MEADLDVDTDTGEGLTGRKAINELRDNAVEIRLGMSRSLHTKRSLQLLQLHILSGLVHLTDGGHYLRSETWVRFSLQLHQDVVLPYLGRHVLCILPLAELPGPAGKVLGDIELFSRSVRLRVV